jgi:glycosyltransferase A (GT-A) superfamily protein (DUF2064 family)
MHLTIIAKTPEPGRVKTRLCPPCTVEQAAEIAAAALADTMAAVDATVADGRWTGRVRRVMLLDGQPGQWIPRPFDVVAQHGIGLAERLANGFDELGPGVIVGMDTPAGGRWLGDAICAVSAGCDVVGLASDGGYWVIGLATTDRRVFDGIPMSESHTGIAQVRQLHRLGRPVRMLPMTRDLDDIADLLAHARSDDPGRLAAVARVVVDRLG